MPIQEVAHDDRITYANPLWFCAVCNREKTSALHTWSIVRRMGHVQEINCWMYHDILPKNCKVLCPSCLENYVRDEVSE